MGRKEMLKKSSMFIITYSLEGKKMTMEIYHEGMF
jgi:hypothetical protein